MPQPSNKISKLWQELKRRKVVRVITVYAAAAFVILVLVSIIVEPLRLPEWTLQLAIVFLFIGFIIALSAQLSGMINTLGWINVAIWLL